MRMPEKSMNRWQGLLASVLFAAGLAPVPLALTMQQANAKSNCYSTTSNNNTLFLDQLSGASCTAPIATTTSQSAVGPGGNRWDTQVYLGFSLPLEQGFNPHLVGGVRTTNINASGFVYGADIGASVSLLKGLADAQSYLVAVAGGPVVQGEGGVGWDVGKRSFILRAGAQVPHVRASIDYAIDDKSLRAFLELNTLAAILPALTTTEMTTTSLSCADSATNLHDPTQALMAFLLENYGSGDLFDGMQTNGNPYKGTELQSSFVNGKTCFQAGELG
jgi:hypothetical protein